MPESLDTETFTAIMPVLEDTWKSGGITRQEWRAILRDMLYLEQVVEQQTTAEPQG